ncbi:MAG TPA: RNA methyltransferase [Firmicutes bacterium]|nr:RNA methyltransferase [Candidatus Fermentithermobacillaceae bacterium]
MASSNDRDVPWRFVKSLHLKKHRDEVGLSLAEGLRVVKVCIDAGVEIQSLFLSREFVESTAGEAFQCEVEAYRRVAAGLSGRLFPVYTVRDELFEKMSATEAPQGVLAVIPVPPRFIRAQPRGLWPEPLVVVGSGIQDPGNVGTMVRTAAAFGATEVIFGNDSADPFSPKAIRASAGGFVQVKVTRVRSVEDELCRWSEQGVTLWKTHPAEGTLPWEAPLTGPVAIAFGSEARGLPASLDRLIPLALRVPMPGGVESLNVGVSCAIILYEVLRQRSLPRGLSTKTVPSQGPV